MASELHIDYSPLTGKTVYYLIRNMFGQIWNGSTFEVYNNANYSTYKIAATEQGASGFYTANFPTGIVAGVYNVTAKDQAGVSAAQTDLSIGGGTYAWTGYAVRPIQGDQVWRSQFKKKTLTSTQQKFYADDGIAVEVTESVSDDTITQVQNAGT